jgi:hypothetical protein
MPVCVFLTKTASVVVFLFPYRSALKGTAVGGGGVVRRHVEQRMGNVVDKCGDVAQRKHTRFVGIHTSMSIRSTERGRGVRWRSKRRST